MACSFTIPAVTSVHRQLCLFFIFSVVFQCSHGKYWKTEQCATLFSEPNAEGLAFMLNDQDQSTNLVEDQRASVTGWNHTGTIVIESGCQVEVCNETYFDGNCETLHDGSYSSDQSSFLGDTASVQCTCAKQCKCSDVHIKKSSCGRAYLKGGCRTCHSWYADLSLDEQVSKEFPDFEHRVEAIRLRRGCKLTIYSEIDFEGDERLIDSETVENFKGDIGSYTCSCDDDMYQPKIPDERPDSYPPLIEIPPSMDDVIKLLANETFQSHIGLRAARRSYRNGRSSKNAYILLIGSTGAGKSSSINLLFDNPNITKVGDIISTTSAIHEFRIPVSVDELGITNSELRVIDTPGLGDTRGLEQDAKFLATLDSYLSSHEELKDRIPNVVLIYHKFNDNRFGGEGSQFVKMIRGLDEFSNRITDDKYSNVIFVFSHFCSISRKASRRPEARIKMFKDVIQDFATYPRPTHIVVAENKPRDQFLPMVNGYYKLPNNEYYPRNLFEKLELVTEKGGDPIGLGVFTTAFRNSDYFNISSSTFHLVPSQNGKVEKYLSILSNANIGVTKTEVAQHLESTWNLKLDAELRKKFPFSLAYLQKALNLRNINQMKDVPRTTQEILSLLTALKHDEATRTLLEKGLGIKSPVFPLNTVAGYSYNVFLDTHLPASPFQLGNVQDSDIGFQIPKSLTCKLEPGTKENFVVLENKESYLQHRLQSLGIEGTIPTDKFTDSIKPGCNIETLSFRNDSCSISAAKDFRLFEFILNDKLDLNPEFQSTVNALPPFNETDHDNVEQWKNFFNTYGTHVVKSVYGGGSIQVRLESNQAFNDNFKQAIFDLIRFAEDLTLDNDEETEIISNRTILEEGTSQSSSFIGGSPDFHIGDLGKISATEASKLLAKWKKSLKFTPAILNTDMRLVPISQIVKKKMGQNVTQEIDSATRRLFQSELRYTPPSKNQAPPPDRTSTEIIALQKMLFDQQEKFNNMSIEVKLKEAENERKRLELEKATLEWKINQTILDNEFKKWEKNFTAAAAQQKSQLDADQKEAARKHELAMAQLDKELKQLQEDAKKAEHDRDMEKKREEKKIEPKKKGGGCLKAGTKILIEDFSERAVETLKVGDVILDMHFLPTKVLGVTHEFLLEEKFYGFKQNSAFFTSNHLFVGPFLESEYATSKTNLFALSSFELYLNNPLMAYLNVSEMVDSESSSLFRLRKSSSNLSLSTVTVTEVFPDPVVYPVDTLMYDIQVDSPTGTYFANGHVCRHEVPPVHYWPNTMSVMFRLMDTPAFQTLPLIPYTVGNVRRLHGMMDEMAEVVEDFLANRIKLLTDEKQISSNVTSGRNKMTLEEIPIEESISRLFSNPIVSTTGVRLYAKAGLVIAGYLDNVRATYVLNDDQVAILQHELFSFINFELERNLSQL